MAYHPPDGIPRSDTTERKLNEAFALLFRDGAGELVLKYLRSITIESVAGPNVEPDRLMHLEGQRFVVALIEQRIRLGREKRPNEEDRHERGRDLRTDGGKAGGRAR